MHCDVSLLPCLVCFLAGFAWIIFKALSVGPSVGGLVGWFVFLHLAACARIACMPVGVSTPVRADALQPHRTA